MRTVEHCIVCGHGPLVLSHLYDHLRRSHSWNEAQIDGEKLRIRAKKGSLRCDICDKIYSTLHSLRHHKLKLHPSGKTSSNVICPECGQRFYTYRDLAKHCNDWHTTKPATQDYSIITGQFDCYTAFE
ncbi:zinc finger, C2H2 type, partial [Cooperia oncophora]